MDQALAEAVVAAGAAQAAQSGRRPARGLAQGQVRHGHTVRELPRPRGRGGRGGGAVEDVQGEVGAGEGLGAGEAVGDEPARPAFPLVLDGDPAAQAPPPVGEQRGPAHRGAVVAQQLHAVAVHEPPGHQFPALAEGEGEVVHAARPAEADVGVGERRAEQNVAVVGGRIGCGGQVRGRPAAGGGVFGPVRNRGSRGRSGSRAVFGPVRFCRLVGRGGRGPVFGPVRFRGAAGQGPGVGEVPLLAHPRLGALIGVQAGPAGPVPHVTGAQVQHAGDVVDPLHQLLVGAHGVRVDCREEGVGVRAQRPGDRHDPVVVVVPLVRPGVGRLLPAVRRRGRAGLSCDRAPGVVGAGPGGAALARLRARLARAPAAGARRDRVGAARPLARRARLRPLGHVEQGRHASVISNRSVFHGADRSQEPQPNSEPVRIPAPCRARAATGISDRPRITDRSSVPLIAQRPPWPRPHRPAEACGGRDCDPHRTAFTCTVAIATQRPADPCAAGCDAHRSVAAVPDAAQSSAARPVAVAARRLRGPSQSQHQRAARITLLHASAARRSAARVDLLHP